MPQVLRNPGETMLPSQWADDIIYAARDEPEKFPSSITEGTPHLNCNDALQGALLRHAGDGRSHDFQPLTLLEFCF